MTERSAGGDPQAALRTESLPPRGWWGRLNRKIDEVGLRYTATLVIRAVIPVQFLGFTRMIVLELLPKTARGATDERISWAVPADCRNLAALGHPVEVIQRRFSAGARACVLTEREGMVLAYVWFHGPYHDEVDLGVRFTLTTGELWLFDAMVRADQRGQRFYPILLRGAAHDLSLEGVKRILIAIDTANRNSIRAHETVGARPLTSVWSLRVFGLSLVYYRHGFQIAWTGRRGHMEIATSRLA